MLKSSRKLAPLLVGDEVRDVLAGAEEDLIGRLPLVHGVRDDSVVLGELGVDGLLDIGRGAQVALVEDLVLERTPWRLGHGVTEVVAFVDGDQVLDASSVEVLLNAVGGVFGTAIGSELRSEKRER